MSHNDENSTKQDPIRDREDEAALSALESLNPGWSGATNGLQREFVELFGVLPRALDPVQVSPGCKEALLARINSESSSKAASEESHSGAKVFEFERPSVADKSVPVEVVRRPARPWLMPLAAALALATVGLSGSLGWVMGQMNEQKTTLVRLEQEVEVARMAEHRLRVVTTKGTEVCKLMPMGDSPVQPNAQATFYMAPERKGWVLSAENLEPCDQGNRYHVWFMLEDGAVSGGSFFVKTAGKIEISADQIPEGMTGIMITLEKEDQVQPTGPMILYGNEAEMVI